MNTTGATSTENRMTDKEIKDAHSKVWKQQMWEGFQRFIAFDVIPFIVIATVVGCFVIGAATMIGLIFNAANN